MTRIKTLSEIKKAKKTYHSTAKEAALLAREIGSELLIIGHYSARYTSSEVLLDEAKDIFENTYAAEQKKIFDFSKA